jgi:hypothetical protein
LRREFGRGGAEPIFYREYLDRYKFFHIASVKKYNPQRIWDKVNVYTSIHLPVHLSPQLTLTVSAYITVRTATLPEPAIFSKTSTCPTILTHIVVFAVIKYYKHRQPMNEYTSTLIK